MNRFQVMKLATAIAAHEQRVFGDSCLITALCDIIRTETVEPCTFQTPAEAVRYAESHLVDVVNWLDQADDQTKVTRELGQRADVLLRDVQKMAEWMERAPEPADVD